MPGRTLNGGRYELEDLPLPGGAMGQVWFGRDTKLDREVVVKFPRLPGGHDTEQVRRRFRREWRITARLEHPGVPAIYDVGDEAGKPFIVMQRVHGPTLEDVIAEEGPLSIGWATGIAAQVCAVLAVAHAAKLIHRDLKPANLILEPHGGVKVLDFGLAAAPELTEFSRITQSGVRLGTPAYMAPEQIETSTSGPASDLYALGCILHELLTGKRLFPGKDTHAVMAQQVNDVPPALRSARPDLPEELERIVAGLLEKKPGDRPADAETVYDRLLPYVTDLAPLAANQDPSPSNRAAHMYAGALSRVTVSHLTAGGHRRRAAR
ncbi:putative serine/threonine protein kinase [Actinoplanes missouriensis 431]|uniref:non-specific serine/threonine protein kinase n=1 Tax=Actinoplanes missouriensis (strain ATCC 14538 / DSM 43046 / CBS 188.64 / JCM 3121 / NBRC 102363 / NCIMB 12654 / NRRL B-3342 / UNCC 431) TaxID=512565 RepID=I0HE04_ACTM4|nr:serine/threonine-protein kinase [Actinoplanes missouriensis]BAL91241.1 putative serine/threonine protein kinase [Actinoplanes missouriensis 431]